MNYEVVICKQIHACFASMSSSDVWVERPLDPRCKDLIEKAEESGYGLGASVDFDEGKVALYVESDRTFYEKALAERSGFLGRHYNVKDDPDFKALIDSYIEQGWKVRE